MQDPDKFLHLQPVFYFDLLACSIRYLFAVGDELLSGWCCQFVVMPVSEVFQFCVQPLDQSVIDFHCIFISVLILLMRAHDYGQGIVGI